MNAETSPTARTVLFVDDDATFRTRLVRAFTERGHVARGAESHKEALAAVQEWDPE